MVNHPNRSKDKYKKRTSQSLRDILFDELEELRSGEGNPSKSMAVANLAKQIINIAKVEIEFHRAIVEMDEGGHPLALGKMVLGTESAAAAGETATAP